MISAPISRHCIPSHTSKNSKLSMATMTPAQDGSINLLQPPRGPRRSISKIWTHSTTSTNHNIHLVPLLICSAHRLVDLCDFPYLDLSPTTYDKQDIQPPPLDSDFPQGDQVVHLRCIIRTIGLLGDDEKFPKLFQLDQSEPNGIMADTGANLCMVDSEMHLVNCWDIKPVHIGLALKSSCPATHYTCT